MKNRRQWLAVLVCVMILLMPLLSETYIVKNKRHNCPRRECPICMELHMAEYLIDGFKILLPIVSCGVLIGVIWFRQIGRQIVYHRTPITLITLKVELLN